MNNKKEQSSNNAIRYFSLSALALAIGLNSSQVEAARIEVNDSTDKVSANSADGLCSLRDAVLSVSFGTFNTAGTGSQANGCVSSNLDPIGTNDLIEFADQLNNTTIAFTVPALGLPIGGAASVNSEGRNITISANKQSRHFNIAGGPGEAVTLNNLTFIEGLIDGEGQNFGSSLAVFLDTTLTITNSTIVSNTAAQSAAIWVNGPNSKVIIEDSVIRNNIGLGANVFGGGILLNQGADMEIRRSTVSNNFVDGRGGGFTMGVDAGKSVVDVEDSTISGNTATGNGGGIDVTSGTLSLENSTISGNDAGNAGGISVSEQYADQSKLIVKNSTIAFNSSDAVGGLNILDSSEAEIENSILANSIGNNLANANCVKEVSAAVIGDPQSFVVSNVSCDFGVDQNPGLLSLGANGAVNKTHALQLDALAINAGNNATCLSDDQRGIMRLLSVVDACDVGAFEQTEEDRENLKGGFIVIPLKGKKAIVMPN